MCHRPALWMVHHWIGLYVGVALVVLSLSGALSVFMPQLSRALYQSRHQVQPLPAGYAAPDRLQALHSALSGQFAAYQLLGIQLPEGPTDPLLYDFHQKEQGDRPALRRFVFVDPYTARVLDVVDGMNTWDYYLRQLHVRLLDSLYGRQLVGMAGVGLLVLTATGALLYGRFSKRQGFWEVRWRKGGRIRWADLHKLVGMLALAFNLMIAFTGAWLGFQPKLKSWFGIEAPNRQGRAEKLLPAADDRLAPFDLQALLRQAGSDMPDLRPTEVLPSADGRRTVEVRGEVPWGPFEPGANRLVYDKADGRLLLRYDLRERPWTEQCYFMQEGLHFGRFGGLGLQVLYAVLGLTSGLLGITGFGIYMARHKKRYPKASVAFAKVYRNTLLGVGVVLLFGLLSVYVGYATATAVATPLMYLCLAGGTYWILRRR